MWFRVYQSYCVLLEEKQKIWVILSVEVLQVKVQIHTSKRKFKNFNT